MSKTQPTTLAEFVRQRREALGLTAYEVSERAGLHRSYWGRLEAGRVHAPGPEAMQGIADAINVPVKRLFKIVGVERHHDPQQLPKLRPYLRAKYHLPSRAISELETYFTFLRAHYGIPGDKPVFPPKATPAQKARAAKTKTRTPERGKP